METSLGSHSSSGNSEHLLHRQCINAEGDVGESNEGEEAGGASRSPEDCLEAEGEVESSQEDFGDRALARKLLLLGFDAEDVELLSLCSFSLLGCSPLWEFLRK